MSMQEADLRRRREKRIPLMEEEFEEQCEIFTSKVLENPANYSLDELRLFNYD